MIRSSPIKRTSSYEHVIWDYTREISWVNSRRFVNSDLLATSHLSCYLLDEILGAR
jgi:hypothetical protein